MQIPIMKKAIIPILTAAISMTLFTACHHDSLEDRAERDARTTQSATAPLPSLTTSAQTALRLHEPTRHSTIFTRFATKPTTQKSSISTKPV